MSFQQGDNTKRIKRGLWMIVIGIAGPLALTQEHTLLSPMQRFYLVIALLTIASIGTSHIQCSQLAILSGFNPVYLQATLR